MCRSVPILFLLLATLPLSAETMTKGERDRAMSELHASRKLFLDAVAGLSPTQLEFKAAEGKWSIADIAEHLALTEELLFGVYKQAVAGPADSSKKAAMTDEELLKAIRSRDQKVQAPEPAVPKRSFSSVAAAVNAFRERRDRNIQFVETNQDDGVRQKILPNFGMDAYQVFLLLAAHTQRHVEQLREVQSAAGYPKSR